MDKGKKLSRRYKQRLTADVSVVEPEVIGVADLRVVPVAGRPRAGGNGRRGELTDGEVLLGPVALKHPVHVLIHLVAGCLPRSPIVVAARGLQQGIYSLR